MMKKANLLFIIVLFISLLFLQGSSVINELPFVKANSGNLVVAEEGFNFIGANTVYLIFYDSLGFKMERVFKAAKESNIKVMRVYMNWGGWSKLKEYDKILSLASEYGIYVIVTLTDCARSNDYRSLENYYEERPFCNIGNEESIKAYKRRIKNIINRQNSITGEIYKNDSTILAWDIANEIEYWNFNMKEVKKWINEIVNYIKSIDSNHLVTVGTSVNFGTEGEKLYHIFKHINVDFYSLHYYPISENWNGKKPPEGYKGKLKKAIKRISSLGKPIVLEEFDFSSCGSLNSRIRKNPATKDIYYSVFKDIMDVAFSSGCSGVMFWGWGVPEARQVDYWWGPEIHSISETSFVKMIKNYDIPLKNE